MTSMTVESMREAIERSGYYPSLVIDALDTALAGEPVNAFVVQHEATFDHSELRRHITVLVLTPTRLVVGHTDEHPVDETTDRPYATAGTEAVRIEKVNSVVVARVATNPETYSPDRGVAEVMLTIGWGAVSRIDLEPAACGDPNCEADHGYAGTTSNDDFSLRVSEAADGAETVEQVLAFAQALSKATSHLAL
ncbi:MAG: DUF5998 family protein [Actinobacteria bacterium]|nr:DUF5998 family protein [Actinomycetota bacterium]